MEEVGVYVWILIAIIAVDISQSALLKEAWPMRSFAKFESQGYIYAVRRWSSSTWLQYWILKQIFFFLFFYRNLLTSRNNCSERRPKMSPLPRHSRYPASGYRPGRWWCCCCVAQRAGSREGNGALHGMYRVVVYAGSEDLKNLGNGSGEIKQICSLA
jgi:hypothetical protein